MNRQRHTSKKIERGKRQVFDLGRDDGVRDRQTKAKQGDTKTESAPNTKTDEEAKKVNK